MSKSIVIPAYFRTQFDWDRIIANKEYIHSVIVNEHSGPGIGEKYYLDLIKKLKELNIKVYGYVSTQWGRRSLEDIKKDIDKWRLFHGVLDIFLDEGSQYKEHVDHYKSIRGLIRGTNIINPGVIPSEEYFQIFDIVCMFESELSKLDSIFDTGTLNKFRHKLYFIIFNVSEATLPGVVRTLKGMYIYPTDLTDKNDGNPFIRLPAFWQQLINIVKYEKGFGTLTMLGLKVAWNNFKNWMGL